MDKHVIPNAEDILIWIQINELSFALKENGAYPGKDDEEKNSFDITKSYSKGRQYPVFHPILKYLLPFHHGHVAKIINKRPFFAKTQSST